MMNNEQNIVSNPPPVIQFGSGAVSTEVTPLLRTYCMMYILALNVHTYCMLYVFTLKKCTFLHFILTIFVVHREWVNLTNS